MRNFLPHQKLLSGAVMQDNNYLQGREKYEVLREHLIGFQEDNWYTSKDCGQENRIGLIMHKLQSEAPSSKAIMIWPPYAF